jgi:hypothetical protein
MACFCRIALLGSIGAKVVLASRLVLIDTGVERALNVLRKMRKAFAHSTESAYLADPVHRSRLTEVYELARANPLWAPLETVLAAQPPTTHGPLGGLCLPTSRVELLVGAKPRGAAVERLGFRYAAAGRQGREAAWRLETI